MLFVIGSSVAMSALRGDVESADFLRRMIDSRARGKNLIYATKKTSKLVQQHFSESGNERLLNIFTSVSRKFREKKQIIENLTRFVFISCHAGDARLARGRAVYISPELANQKNLLDPTIFLGEALTDCELYVNALAANFTEGLPMALRQMRLSQRFEPGGGGNTHLSYRRYLAIGDDLCLCIVDSDRKCPNETPGDTAKFVIEAHRKFGSALCSYLLIDAYSAENLLPTDEIKRQYNVGKSTKQISDFEIAMSLRNGEVWKYLPLKKGIRGKDIKLETASSRYWTAKLTELGYTIPCCVEKDCSCSIIPGIHDKTLASALEERNLGWTAKLANEKNKDIKDSYLAISHAVRSWLCVGSTIRS